MPEDVKDLTAAEVRYAINEIYARHGATFPYQQEAQQQFRRFGWYAPALKLRLMI